MSFPPWESLGLSNLFLSNDDIFHIPESTLPTGYSLIDTPLEPSEHEELARVLHSAFGIQHGEWDAPRITKEFLDDPSVKKTWRLAYTSPDGLSSIAGTASIRIIPDKYPASGYMHWVAVDPKHQGRGLAMHLSSAVLREARDVHGFKRCVLETQDTSLPAIATYEKLGFQPVYLDDSHPVRWAVIRENLNARKKSQLQSS
jgi:mycothiol synthase